MTTTAEARGLLHSDDLQRDLALDNLFQLTWRQSRTLGKCLVSFPGLVRACILEKPERLIHLRPVQLHCPFVVTVHLLCLATWWSCLSNNKRRKPDCKADLGKWTNTRANKAAGTGSNRLVLCKCTTTKLNSAQQRRNTGISLDFKQSLRPANNRQAVKTCVLCSVLYHTYILLESDQFKLTVWLHHKELFSSIRGESENMAGLRIITPKSLKQTHMD